MMMRCTELLFNILWVDYSLREGSGSVVTNTPVVLDAGCIQYVCTRL